MFHWVIGIRGICSYLFVLENSCLIKVFINVLMLSIFPVQINYVNKCPSERIYITIQKKKTSLHKYLL